jgi:WhiB family redox-sensing transcriptional regulator
VRVEEAAVGVSVGGRLSRPSGEAIALGATVVRGAHARVDRARWSTPGSFTAASSDLAGPDLLASGAYEAEDAWPETRADDLSWQERALCAQTDPESFFPEKGGSTREAKRVCLSCEVRAECLEYALGNDERFGIWGGLSERERRRLKKMAG